MVGGQKRTLPVDLDEVLLGGPCGQRFRTAAAVVVARLRERGEPRAQERQDFIALEVVRLCERDAELDRVVEHRQFAPHPFVDGCAAGIRQRIRRALRPVAVAVDADLGDEALPFEPRDGVIHRAVRDRDDAVVVPMAHEPDHLVRMHLALAQQREHHHPERGEAGGGILHDYSISISPSGLYPKPPKRGTVRT